MPVVATSLQVASGLGRRGQSKAKLRWVQTFDAHRICSFLDKLVDSTLITLGKVVLWQKIGIPMGTDYAPFWANLYSFSYELAFL